MQLWTAFILGLAGSLHCAAMCGPLALLVPVTGSKTSQRVLSRLSYNFGRLLSYAMIGALVGTFGHVFAIVGLQRWLSIAAGSIILIALTVSIFDLRFSIANGRHHRPGLLRRGIMLIKGKFNLLLGKKTLLSIAGLGALNGLLPCGLVYVACAAAAATATAVSGAAYMVIFGLGTIPMLLSIAFGGSFLNLDAIKVRRLIPIVAAIAGVLLIVRGLALGIPYLSPSSAGHCPACLHPQL